MPDASPAPTRSRATQIAVQLGGFVVALALLAFVVHRAFGGENRAQLDKLRDAPWTHVALLILLSLITLAVNGLIFQVTLRPVRRLPALDVLSVNALSAFLGYLPLKLGLLFRVAVHSRRDRLPLLTIGAWFAAVAGIMLGVVAVLLGASLAAKEMNARWFAIALPGLALGGLLVIAMSRLFAGDVGRDRLTAFADRLRLPLLPKLLRSEHYRQLHAATDILANPRAVYASIGLRVADFALQAARVPIAAALLDQHLPYTQAFMVAATSFIVGIVWPSGPVGSREASVVAVCALLGLPNRDAFAAATLLLTATEAVAYAIGALAGLIWLRPTRLFTPKS